jgi:hypothetical protein
VTQRTEHGYLPGTRRGCPPGRRTVAATLGCGLILWAAAAPAVAAYAAPASQTRAAPVAAQARAAAASTGAETQRAWAAG